MIFLPPHVSRRTVAARVTYRILGLLLLCAVAPGCSMLNLRQPTASLRGARVADVSPQAVTAIFDLNIENPNSVALPVSAASYQLSLSGVQVLSDQTKPDGTLPANGSLPVTLPVQLRFDQLLAAEQAIARSGGNVPYQFDGGLTFSSGKLASLGELKVPLHFTGTLDFRKAVEEAIQNPRTVLELAQNPNGRKFFEAVMGRSIGGGGLLGR